MSAPPVDERAQPARPTPPVLFLFLDLPFGAAVGYVAVVRRGRRVPTSPP